MSRMMGRSEELYYFSDFYLENQPKEYKEKNKIITFEELNGVLADLEHEIPYALE